jgi:hypothetical protein
VPSDGGSPDQFKRTCEQLCRAPPTDERRIAHPHPFESSYHSKCDGVRAAVVRLRGRRLFSPTGRRLQSAENVPHPTPTRVELHVEGVEFFGRWARRGDQDMCEPTYDTGAGPSRSSERWQRGEVGCQNGHRNPRREATNPIAGGQGPGPIGTCFGSPSHRRTRPRNADRDGCRSPPRVAGSACAAAARARGCGDSASARSSRCFACSRSAARCDAAPRSNRCHLPRRPVPLSAPDGVPLADPTGVTWLADWRRSPS